MKLPALCLAAAFAGGVAVGLFTALANLRSSLAAVVAAFVLSIALLVLSAAFVKKNIISVAGSVCLDTWLVLGILSAWIAWRPAPANHFLSLVSTGRVDLSSLLRWRGHLRDEPAEFPWGISLNLGLDSVEFEGAGLDLAGGMRVTYSSMLARRRVAAPAILDNSQIGAFWVGREVLTPALAKLEAVARTRGIQVTHETRGQSFNLDGATGEVLWPTADTGDIETAAKNNDSLGIRP